MKFLSILSIVSLLFFGCNNNPKTVDKDLSTVETSSVVKLKEHPGKKLMETHCYLCHSPTAAHDVGRIAPPMVAIKAHYLKSETTKEAFVEQMVAFVNNPTAESAKLKGAVKRFGVMPKQQYPEGVVAQIADYMYNYYIEEPSWFKEHWKEQGFGEYVQSGEKFAETEKPKTYEEIGLEYALSTKQILGKNLMGAIQKEGTLSALEFCNIQAMPLTDSMATTHRATIKRVSDKNRNPNNKANAEELEHIALFKKQIAANIEPTPIAIDKGDKVQFYYPITTNSMCLQCHGNTKNIQPQVRMKLLKLYPNDLATGYSENEVRGIWSIAFNKTENNKK